MKKFEFYSEKFSTIIEAETMENAVLIFTDQYPLIEPFCIQTADLPEFSYPEDVIEKAFNRWANEARITAKGWAEFDQATGKELFSVLKFYINRVLNSE